MNISLTHAFVIFELERTSLSDRWKIIHGYRRSTSKYLVHYRVFRIEVLHTSNHQKCSIKKCVLKIFAIFTVKHLFCSLFLIKLQALKRGSNIGVCSCEYCKDFKNTYFEKHLRMVASDRIYKANANLFRCWYLLLRFKHLSNVMIYKTRFLQTMFLNQR